MEHTVQIRASFCTNTYNVDHYWHSITVVLCKIPKLVNYTYLVQCEQINKLALAVVTPKETLFTQVSSCQSSIT